MGHETGQKEGADAHIHQVEQVIYLLESNMKIVPGDIEQMLGPNELVLFPAGVSHALYDMTPTAKFIVIFAPPRDVHLAASKDIKSVTKQSKGGLDIMTKSKPFILVKPDDVDAYIPGDIPGDYHSKIINKCLMGPSMGSKYLEVILGRITGQKGGADPHIHENCEQLEYVLEGKMKIVSGDFEQMIGPYELALFPAGASHALYAVTPAVKSLVIYAPPRDVHLAASKDIKSVTKQGKKGLDSLTKSKPFILVKPDDVDAYIPGDIPGDYHSKIKNKCLMGPSMGSKYVEVILVEVTGKEGGADPHIHQVEQVIYLLEGKMKIVCGDFEQMIGPNELVLFPAGVSHAFYAVTPTAKFIVFFAPPREN